MAFSLVVTSLIIGIAGFSVFGLFAVIFSIAYITEDRPDYKKWAILLGIWLAIGVGGMYSYFWLNAHSG